jgi:hypothetical protein
MAVVELVWCSIWVPGFAQYQDIVAEAERIREDGNRSDVDIGVIAWGLAG